MTSSSQAKFTYDYPRPAVTVDLAIVTAATPRELLLIRRKNEPFADAWALPGGFVDMDESLDAAARRELHEETGVRVETIEQLHTFGDPERDPRGRVITVVYLALVDRDGLDPKAADDAAEVLWFPLDQPPPLAFDHAKIIDRIRKRLAAK